MEDTTIDFDEQIESTITALKKVTKMSALDEAFSLIRNTEYADLTKEEQRLCTRWETIIVKCDQLLMETLTEMEISIEPGPPDAACEDPRDYPEEQTGED